MDPGQPGTPAALTQAIHERIATLAGDYLKLAAQQTGTLPHTDFDPDWPSPCMAGEPVDGRCQWQPVAMAPVPDFGRLEEALEVTVHPAVRAAFTTHWSAGLPLLYNENAFELLQLWSEQDFDNLLGNFIGHALEKKRVRQSLTLFFALVDDEQLLTIDNDTGVVLLETLGKPAPEEISASLPDFLLDCSAYFPSHPTS